MKRKRDLRIREGVRERERERERDFRIIKREIGRREREDKVLEMQT